MELQNIEDGFSSRADIQGAIQATLVERDQQKMQHEIQGYSRTYQHREGNIDQSMIGNKEMPWSSIPQKEVAFQNIEQVGQ